jgi:glycosyltransferase involved in cell wall biosynthesis/peptidoglycan/xylan/chitin deacetylase (PgdA/CDA1 family)
MNQIQLKNFGNRQRLQHHLKKLVPRTMQIMLRRHRAKRIRASSAETWPMNKESVSGMTGKIVWPGEKQFALVLTHDVESVSGVPRCGNLMKLEQNFGLKSSFNFVAEDYPVSKDILRELALNGFEIGIHGLKHNPSMFFSRKSFEKQARILNGYISEWGAVGFRAPSMYHNLEWMHALDIEYDASTFDTDPFEPQPDGIQSILPVWIPHRDGTSGYVELPYTLPQDHLLFVVLEETTIDIWKRKLDWIAEHGGMALINTHPDYMKWDQNDPGLEEYPFTLYEEFLEYVGEKYGGRYWHALPREMAAYWKNNYRDTVDSDDKTVTKNMRVCMPTYSFYESDNRVRRYAESLARDGSSVDVFSLRRKGQSSYEEIEGVRVHRIQKRTKKEKTRLSYLVKLLFFFARSTLAVSWHQLKKSYDLVHVHNIPDFQIFAAALPKLMGSKLILDIHDIVPELFCSKFNGMSDHLIFKALCFVEKRSVAFADHVIISNHIWRDRIINRSSLKDKCTVLLNYPDQTIFARRPRQPGDNRAFILYPGTLNRHQGLDIALKAFSRIKDRLPHLDFHIYGDGPSLGELIALAEELGIQDRVQFNDVLPLNQIADVMANAACGIVPKRAEVFGNEAFSTKILEFMTLGIPLIVANTTIDQYYFNSKLLLFFRSGDDADLAEKMVLLFTDETVRNSLVNNSLDFVRAYSWDSNKGTYYSIVSSLTYRNGQMDSALKKGASDSLQPS